MNSEKFVKGLLAKSGVTIDGNKSSDLQVHDKNFFNRFVVDGILGFGESYMENWIDCENIDEFVARTAKHLSSNINKKNIFLLNLIARIKVLGSKNNSHKIGSFHYDIGNELFTHMLDPYMIYSCGYWEQADNLNQAQLDKLELICRKMQLTSGMCILDVGCGWGGFARYAAENYGVEVVGITISKEQLKLAKELNKNSSVELRYQDYRDVNEKFDRIVSIGMFEHVGRKFYNEYMAIMSNCLKNDGLFYCIP